MMSYTFDFVKMEKLLENFYIISNVRYSLVDIDNHLLCHSNDITPFCQSICSTDHGYKKCVHCDQYGATYAMEHSLPYYTYRCHAGLMETTIPIYVQTELVAFIILGQYLDCSDIDAQWEQAKNKITTWYENINELKEQFYQLTTIETSVIKSSAEVLIACTQYIATECVIPNVSRSDRQQLSDYIDQNYAQKITLDSISAALAISKTKLCNVAAKQNTTINTMIRLHRLNAAKTLMENTHYSIAEIANRVGITDYNYFTKLFKSYSNCTPREYMKRFNIDS